MSREPAEVKAAGPPTISADEADDFSFLPKALLEKCRPFVLRHHDLRGYTNLADILWHPQTRAFIERNAKLNLLFRKASISRRAAHTKERLVYIATVILATEI